MSGGIIDLEDSDDLGFVEVDPSGRYGRYNEVLGKGASKTVYRAFDEYEGIEVAWNQVKLHDFLQSPEDLERLYCEIHLLKTLKHPNIIQFHTSWVDTANRTINFVTEMFTSGTLRQYRLKHKKINIRAIKQWCRQILQGLAYLHAHDPPVIHRDLKCDNIFVNGHRGEVKIGDLGLAAILRNSHVAHCVGTPEFMAPEVYEEEYNELVDIYSFGMCILEMVTFEYPYSECTHPAQIYKRVISGRKPDALYKVKDPEVRRFVEKCLATVSDRLSARELLNDPFLQLDDYGYDLRPLEEYDETCIIPRQPCSAAHPHALDNNYLNYMHYEHELNLDSYSIEYESAEIDLFDDREDDHLQNVDITIKGRRNDDETIFLRLRIVDKEGCVRNIYFPFDIDTDTALCVATEMVAELDIMDQEVTKIAEMIDGEITALVPKWRRGVGVEERRMLNDSTTGCCLSMDGPYMTNEAIQCPNMHSRFEELTDESEASEHCDTEDAPVGSSESDGIRSSNSISVGSHSDHKHETLGHPAEDWLKSSTSDSNGNKRMIDDLHFMSNSTKGNHDEFLTNSFEQSGMKQKMYEYGCSYSSRNPVHLVTTAKSFYSNALLPHRATASLPVDASDF